MRIVCSLCIFVFLCTYCIAYRPVVLIHGIMSSNSTLLGMAAKIQAAHPGTKVYAPDMFVYWSSLVGMWHQIASFASIVLKISYDHPDGINIIGYSQGGLIARGILEMYPKINVKTFISLSSPQGGQYGAELLNYIFRNISEAEAYKLFYNDVGQTISVGNYWRDPFHETLYLEHSHFLPYLNNHRRSPNSRKFKEGITSLDKFVLIGGPDDGIVGPWQSSHFAFYDEDLNVVPLENQLGYQDDALGLKTLNETGRMQLITFAGVNHTQWHENDTVINDFIIPNLD